MKFEQYKLHEIKVYISLVSPSQWADTSLLLINDHRVSVRKLGEELQGKVFKLNNEQARLEAMAENDRLFSLGAQTLCGVDEAGRGPLAGPVVAAAVILPQDFRPLGLNDSKKVPEARRNLLYEQIIENAYAWGVGIVTPQRIDAINILEATREAMVTAIRHMKMKPDFILLDAVEITSLDIPHKGIIKGDEKCLSIAAASIIAKVTRDRLMMDLGAIFPQYGFEIHKGYGTVMHYEALKNNGLTAHHRRSFLKNWYR